MPGFASGSISCFIYLKFSGLNGIFTPETGFRRGHVSCTVTVYDDYSLSASPPRFLPDTKKPSPLSGAAMEEVWGLLPSAGTYKTHP